MIERMRSLVLVQSELEPWEVSKKIGLLRCHHRVPYSGRTSVFETQYAEIELTLANPAQQFDPGDGDRRRSESLRICL